MTRHHIQRLTQEAITLCTEKRLHCWLTAMRQQLRTILKEDGVSPEQEGYALQAMAAAREKVL